MKIIKRIFLTSFIVFALIGNIFASGNDANTVSLLHMDGADTSTTFTDDAAGGTHTWTAGGNAQIDTAQSVFGGASGLFDGNGDSITTGDSDDFSFGTGNFTIDFRIRNINLPDPGYDEAIVGQLEDASNKWRIYFDAGTIGIIHRSGGATQGQVYAGSLTISVNTWYHFEICRNGSDILIFQDGVSKSVTTATSYASNDVGNVAASAFIGGNATDGWTDANVDEFRITKGVCRHTSNFTPPTSAYDDIPDVTVTAGQVIWIE